MKCLIDECDGVAKIRGLCPICYQAAASAIKKYNTTWEELESAGLANEPQHKSSGNGAFTKAYIKKLSPLARDMMDRDIIEQRNLEPEKGL